MRSAYADVNFGNDSLSGGVGDDMLLAGNGNDRAGGDDGNDAVVGGVGDDGLGGGTGHDIILGDTLFRLATADRGHGRRGSPREIGRGAAARRRCRR